jgi:hypothetical protein
VERARQEAQAASFAASGAKAEELRRRAAQRRKVDTPACLPAVDAHGLRPRPLSLTHCATGAGGYNGIAKM